MKKAFIVFVLILAVLAIHAENIEVIKNSLKGKTYNDQASILERYISNDNKNISVYLLKAGIEMKNLDFVKGRSTLQAALKIDPSDIRILDLLGICLFQLNKPDEALKCFKRSLEIDKTDGVASLYSSLINPLNTDNEQPGGKKTAVDVKELANKYGDIGGQDKKDFVYLLNSRETTVKDERTMDYSVHCIVKILNTQGANAFRNFQYAFNSFEYVPEVTKAGSYDENFKFTGIDSKNIVIIDKKDPSDNSIYSNRRYVAFPLPGIKAGSVIEYDIRFNSTGKNLSTNVFDRYIFGGYDRTAISQYVVRYPENMAVNVFLKGTGLTPAGKRENGIVEKTYTFENPPVFDVKNESVSIFDRAPLAMISTFKDWDSISKWYSDAFERNIKSGINTDDASILPDLSKKTKSEKSDILYAFVQKNIHYVGVELAESAMIPHAPAEVFKNKFGDCKDQAMLLIYLLRTYGIEACPVLVSTPDNGQVEKKVPSPFFFNHVIVFVPKQDGIGADSYYDTTSSFTASGNLPSADQGAAGFIIKKDGTGSFVEIPAIPYDRNVLEEDYKVETGMAGNGNIDLSIANKGAFSEIIRYSLAGRTADDIKDYFFNRNKKGFANLNKDDLMIEGTDRQSGDIVLRLKSAENSVADVFFDGRLKINFQIKEIGSLINLPQSPENDVTENFAFTYRKNVEYSFPDDYKVTEGEIKNIRKENDYMVYEFSADRTAENRLKFNFEFILKKRTIRKDDVRNAAQFVSDIGRNINFELTLENKKSFDDEKFFEGLAKAYRQKEVYENYVRKLIEKRNNAKAQEICVQGIKLFPEDMFFYIVESTILTDQKKFDEAESLLTDAMNIDGNNPDIYLYLSEVYGQSKDFKKQEATLVEANGKFTDNNLISALITFYKRNEMPDNGIEFVRKLADRQPGNSSFFSELGYFYSLKKDLARAEEAFMKSIELNPKNAQSLNNLAWLYCENDVKIKDAIEYSRKACDIDPYNDSFLDTLAEAYFKNRDYDLAVEAINRAIKINPNYTYLKLQLDKIEKARSLMNGNK
jgi:tetratricopeptide (TPR) repeat protein